MQVIWSPHAEELLDDIVLGIAQEQSADLGLKWATDIRKSVSDLNDFPKIGNPVPAKCFFYPPPDLDKLRQVFCGPYRIVYEVTSVACYVYSVRHTRMLLSDADAEWR